MIDSLTTILSVISQPDVSKVLTMYLGFVVSILSLYSKFRGKKHVIHSESSLSGISDLLDTGQKLGLKEGDVKAVQPSS